MEKPYNFELLDKLQIKAIHYYNVNGMSLLQYFCHLQREKAFFING